MQVSKIAVLFLPAVFFSFLVCFGQDIPSFLLLRGRIINAVSGEAIAYATVSSRADGINTMSNEEGHFIFKIPVDGVRDSVYISHVGYASVALMVDPSDTGIRIIRLQEKAVQLAEVVVNPVNALDLLRRAFARIPDNYPSRPYLMNGFYRMSGTTEDRIIDLSEAVFDIYSPDNDRKNKQIRLIKSRADLDRSAFNGNDVNLGRRPQRLMDFDMVSRIEGTEILGERGLEDHAFVFNGTIDYEGVTAYEIAFDQKDGVERSLYRGRILIDSQSLAFLSFDYILSPKGLKYWPLKQAAKLGGRAQGPIHTDLLSDSVVVKYRKYGEKYYLNHVYTLSRIHFYGDGDAPFDCNPLSMTSNYLVTRVDTAHPEVFRKGEILKDNRLIEDRSKKGSYLADAFWENYNMIEADFNVDSVVRIIRRNNKNPRR
ncbi:MAG TPA: carboxypeptidase-like regulatory domain-containing protein [Puia sp.]|jgi:hypothetical protein